MAYVNSDGTVSQKQPWNFDKLTRIFYGIVSFVVLFFQTLLGLDTNKTPFSSGSGGSSTRGSGGWFGGGGGGGGWGGGNGGGRPGGGGGGGGSSGRFRTMRDINPPTIGGCPGGSCGM